MAALMPQMGPKVRALALEEANWDEEAALNMLRMFQVANLDRLNALVKKRKKILEAIDAAAADEEGEEGAPVAAPQPSPSRSGEASGSSSESGDERSAKKSKRSSKSSKKKSSSTSKSKKDKRKSSKGSKGSKRKRSSRERDRKRRRASASASPSRSRSPSPGAVAAAAAAAAPEKRLTHSTDYGKYGVLREEDLASKHDEFMLWSMEVKGVNPELLARWEEKDLAKAFLEDFNTGTLPHKKYYNLAAHEATERAKASKERSSASGAKVAALNDEEQLRQQRVAERARQAQEQMEFAYKRLKQGGLAEEMRHQELLRAEMTLAYKTGDTAKAQRIAGRLLPDDQRKK